MTHRYGDTTLGRTIELGHDDAIQIERLVKFARLLQTVLTCRGIDDENGLHIHVSTFARDVDDLLQLTHELIGCMQAPRCIDEHEVAPQLFGTLHDVIADTCRVRTTLALHDLDATSLAPDVELLDSSGAEGVARAYKHLAATERSLIGELANRRGLARAVDTHEEHADGVHAERIRVGLGKESADFVSEHVEHGIRVGQRPARGLVAQSVDDLHRRLGTQITQDERFLEVVPEILVELGTTAEQHVHPLVELRPAPIDFVLERHVNLP